MTNALIIVDVQNDFINGSLAVDEGEPVAQKVADLLNSDHTYDFTVTTQDWHIDPGAHWSETPDYVDSWPIHCSYGTVGAELHAAIRNIEVDERFFKGHYSAAYSGFEGVTLGQPITLADWLRERKITEVDICGIATEYCVKATALDAVKEGFETTLLVGLIAPVDFNSGADAINEMAEAGVPAR